MTPHTWRLERTGTRPDRDGVYEHMWVCTGCGITIGIRGGGPVPEREPYRQLDEHYDCDLHVVDRVMKS